MRRVFLDANVFLAAAASISGGSSEVLRRALREDITLVTSQLALREAEKNVHQKLRFSAQRRFFDILSSHSLMVANEPEEDLEKKIARKVYWKDAPILAAAIEAKCQYLITLDQKHLLGEEVKQHARTYGVEVMMPGEYLRILRGGSHKDDR